MLGHEVVHLGAFQDLRHLRFGLTRTMQIHNGFTFCRHNEIGSKKPKFLLCMSKVPHSKKRMSGCSAEAKAMSCQVTGLSDNLVYVTQSAMSSYIETHIKFQYCLMS